MREIAQIPVTRSLVNNTALPPRFEKDCVCWQTQGRETLKRISVRRSAVVDVAAMAERDDHDD